MFDEVWSTSERELAVSCRIAKQMLSFEVHPLKLQLDYEAQTAEVSI
jgi:hypothetical protein